MSSIKDVQGGGRDHCCMCTPCVTVLCVCKCKCLQFSSLVAPEGKLSQNKFTGSR